MRNNRIVLVLLLLVFIISIIFPLKVTACKDIVACGDATDGEYNLFLKLRDPSRPDFQVLCIVPEGYEYTYHCPWTGLPLKSKTIHKSIGVASVNDVIPNIVKAGMAFTSAGIAYGDADTNSKWVNPTKHAWDDFDWLRYSYEKANTEDEAVDLLTIDAVKKMHATGVSENLFVVGPKKGYVIEADAFHYKIKEIKNGVSVMTNYPNELWRTQILNKLPYASSFDLIKEEYVKKGRSLRLNSFYGIRVVDIGSDFIIARQVPFLKITSNGIIKGPLVEIKIGERKNVGMYSVELKDIDGNKAKVILCNKYKAWEDRMNNYIQNEYGSITIEDMINWSRFHEDDLDGLRPMCQDDSIYEAAMIYKIPQNYYDILSCGWFSANHACSSIYVPVHICDIDIFDPYENGDAAALSLELLERYGHDNLSSFFSKAEDVFLFENDFREQISKTFITNTSEVSNFLTDVDMAMQYQAWLTQKIWLETSNISDLEIKQEVIDIIDDIWCENFSVSLICMEKAISLLENISGYVPQIDIIIDKIEQIIFSINEISMIKL